MPVFNYSINRCLFNGLTALDRQWTAGNATNFGRSGQILRQLNSPPCDQQGGPELYRTRLGHALGRVRLLQHHHLFGGIKVVSIDAIEIDAA